MRFVDTLGRLAEALTFACREAVASFGDGKLFLERVVARPPHTEVQVLDNGHGTTPVASREPQLRPC